MFRESPNLAIASSGSQAIAPVTCQDIAGPCVLQSFTASVVPTSERAKFARYLRKQPRISLVFYLGEGTVLEPVEWTLNATTAAIQNMGVDHCCAYVLVAQQLMHRADAVPSGQ